MIVQGTNFIEVPIYYYVFTGLIKVDTNTKLLNGFFINVFNNRLSNRIKNTHRTLISDKTITKL